jgi:membrane-bound ClpP family serine protease
MSPLVWSLLLVVVGLALVLLEVFVPSGGVLGLLAVLALGAGVVTAFVEQGAMVGMGVLAGTLLAVPAVLMLAFRWFPSTPIGRRVLPPPPSADDVLPDLSLRQRLRSLVGRRGRAASELVPWGSVEIDGDSFEAMSEGGPIAPDAPVEVVAVQSRALVVRVAAVVPAARPAEPAAAPAAEPAGPRLSSVLEDFDFEELRQNTGSAELLDPPPPANKA